MKVIPVHFSVEHKTMLTHCKMFLEKGAIQIDPRFDKLIISLRTAVENGEGILINRQLHLMMYLMLLDWQ